MSPVIQSAVQELKAGLQGLLNKEINTTKENIIFFISGIFDEVQILPVCRV
jgi:hypothetical protein